MRSLTDIHILNRQPPKRAETMYRRTLAVIPLYSRTMPRNSISDYGPIPRERGRRPR
jgi:hypothetical protein